MSKGLCPKCGKPLEGQVKLCSLCGTTYHSACLRDTRDCVLCTTKTGSRRNLAADAGGGASRRRSLFLAGIGLALVLAVLFVLLHRRFTTGRVESAVRRHAAMAGADLDLIRQAIERYEKSGDHEFLGTDPNVLGGLLPSVPVDPWGRPYLVDGSVGVIVSFGSDGRPGGTGDCSDLVRYFRAPIHLVSARYIAGDEGAPDGGILQLVFNKAFEITDERLLVNSLDLIEPADSPDHSAIEDPVTRNGATPATGSAGSSGTSGTGSHPARDAAGTPSACSVGTGRATPVPVYARLPSHWTVASGSVYHSPARGLLALVSKARPGAARFIAAIRPGVTRIDVTTIPEDPSCGMRERHATGDGRHPSPCDPTVFGPCAAGLLRHPRPVPCGRNGLAGVAISG